MKTRVFFIGFFMCLLFSNITWGNNKNDDYFQLKEKIATTLSDLIDNVESINFAEKNDYYFYEIIGTKGNNKVTFSLKVSEENFKAKSFNTNYNSNKNEQIIYCYWVLGQCVLPKDDVVNICGRYINEQCVPF